MVRADRQPGLSGGGLYHWAGTGFAEFLRQRAGLGPADSAVDLFPGPGAANAAAPRFGGRCAGLERPRLWRVALRRAAHRGGWNAIRLALHAFSYAKSVAGRARSRVRGIPHWS